LKAVSPVIATLLLIAIAVAAGIILYVFVSGFTGGLTQPGGQQVAEQLSLDAYSFESLSTLTITIRNVGTTPVQIDKLYFDGSMITVSTPLNPQGSAMFTIGLSGITRGTSHIVKVVTLTGSTFTFTVIAGRSG
jgi:flagellin-like protein